MSLSPSEETAVNRPGPRGPGGRFAPGAAPGPGRGRRRPPTEAEEALLEKLRAVGREAIAQGASLEDVQRAAGRLAARAAALRRAS